MPFTRDDLKAALKAYKRMDAKTERLLKEMGFIVERQRNHIVITYIVNGRKLNFSLAKTPSDFRAGRNIVSIIYNEICRAQNYAIAA